jgi:hypothetical protein
MEMPLSPRLARGAYRRRGCEVQFNVTVLVNMTYCSTAGVDQTQGKARGCQVQDSLTEPCSKAPTYPACAEVTPRQNQAVRRCL